MSHSKGLRLDVIAPRSKFYQGPYGRICPDLPAWRMEGTEAEIDAELLDFATREMIELPGKTPGDIAGDQTIIDDLEARFSSNIPAAYTYFGQFIDHDVTFDPAPLTARQRDPSGILNFRTPRLDLDNVYGRGPDDQPYLYDKDDKAKLLIGRVRRGNYELSGLRDLPRNEQGRALIGDMRNDENAMVSQLQLGFLLAHNTLVDRARVLGVAEPFEAARTTLRWLYQWVLWHDFVKRIAVDETHDCALRLEKTCDGRKAWSLGLGDVYKWKNDPFMPVEFAVAAYRFGHSMVRNSYQTNNPHRGFGDFAPIFDNTGDADPDDLRGFRPMTEANTVQWDWFLDMTTSVGPFFPQMARKIDTRLANALAALHEGPAGDPQNVLAFRNLKRGLTFGLPSGTAMARKMCLKEVKLKPGEPDSLWYYILREAEALPGANSGQMLGRLGSTIVCATFAGLLKGDPCSYLNVDPCWTPDDDPLLCPGVDNIDSEGAWELASIIRIAGLPVDSDDVEAQSRGEYPDTVSCVGKASA